MNPSNKRTDEQIEETVNELGYKLLDNYRGKHNETIVKIQDKFGYKYKISLNSLVQGHIPSIVGKSNPYSLENIILWLYLNNSEFELCEDNEYRGATKKLKFYHNYCKEYFETLWLDLFNGHGCGVCSGKQVGKYNNLAYLYPEISSEWHPDNETSSNNITCYSHKKVWWICSECGYGKNKEWFAMISGRTSAGNGCPACSGFVVSNNNRLSLLFPEIASEWHPTKNGDLTPNNTSYGSDKKIWWLCSNGHEYFSSIGNRTMGKTACPRCITTSKGEDEIENFLLSNNIFYTPQKTFENCKNKRELWFDFGIPYEDDSWKCIEYWGKQHLEPVDFFGGKEQFKLQKKLDKIKFDYCRDNNIPLLIIPYWDFDNIDSLLMSFLR